MIKDPINFIDISFTDQKASDSTPYCKEWSIAYFTVAALKYGSPIIISIINLLVIIVFDLLGDFQKSPTLNQRTISTF
jgi:hypothetical protein